MSETQNTQGGFEIRKDSMENIDFVVTDQFGNTLPINKDEITDLMKLLETTKKHGVIEQ